MKHIDKYNKFIKLNEDIKIEGDLDEYDLNIIKAGLIELEDLGWKIDKINIYEYADIYIRLETNILKIRPGLNYYCTFDKEGFDLKSERLSNIILRKTYVSTEYEQSIINTTKECSQLLLNMLDCDSGRIRIDDYSIEDFEMEIFLYKNKTE